MQEIIDFPKHKKEIIQREVDKIVSEEERKDNIPDPDDEIDRSVKYTATVNDNNITIHIVEIEEGKIVTDFKRDIGLRDQAYDTQRWRQLLRDPLTLLQSSVSSLEDQLTSLSMDELRIKKSKIGALNENIIDKEIQKEVKKLGNVRVIAYSHNGIIELFIKPGNIVLDFNEKFKAPLSIRKNPRYARLLELLDAKINKTSLDSEDVEHYDAYREMILDYLPKELRNIVRSYLPSHAR